MLSFEKQIKRARIVLESKGNVPRAFLSPEIRESWQRCLSLGLDPTGEPAQNVIDQGELQGVKHRNKVVLRLARAELKNLYMQISGSNFAILFANRDGIVLESLYDTSFKAAAGTRYLVPGIQWKESVTGTNALGCVLNSGHPTTVHAGEHFFRSFGSLTCVAAPVLDPDGILVGAVDASSNCHQRQHHTHALIKMSCVTIENGLFKSMMGDQFVLEMHNRPEFLGTLQVGLMAFDENGILLKGNRIVKYLFQSAFATPDTPFEDIFNCRFNDFLDVSQRGRLVRLQDLHGSSFAVRLSVPENGAVSTQVLPEPFSVNPNRPGTVKMIRDDPVMKAVVRDVERALKFKAPIHIYGETGTGKEVLSRHIHDVSGAAGKFVAVNCANLTESLAESELFGYRKGAFTGARKDGAPGLILQADGGTLFLDEIGDMPLALQARLLRFLDDWQVRPVGGTAEQKVDIQLITATNRHLDRDLSGKKFRRDLWYRINTMQVHLPPLRERTDFPALVESIVAAFDPVITLEKGAVDELMHRNWPGNIRELKSVLVRIGIKSADRTVTRKQVRSWIGPEQGGAHHSRSRNLFRRHQKDIVRKTHEQLNGNISAVARKLGISRNTVYKHLKKSRPLGHKD